MLQLNSLHGKNGVYEFDTMNSTDILYNPDAMNYCEGSGMLMVR